MAACPGGRAGSVLNGNSTISVWSFTETPASALHTNRARFTRNNRLVSNGTSTHYSSLFDTTYSIETVGDVRLLKFGAMPDGFEASHRFQRLYAQRNAAAWYAFKDSVATTPNFSIRLNREASDALFSVLGIQ